jgi:hypothetical protein
MDTHHRNAVGLILLRYLDSTNRAGGEEGCETCGGTGGGTGRIFWRIGLVVKVRRVGLFSKQACDALADRGQVQSNPRGLLNSKLA